MSRAETLRRIEALEARLDMAGTRQVPRAIRFYGDDEWRSEAERLREIVMGAHAVRCTCGERISGYYPFIADTRCIALQALAASPREP